MCFTQHRVLGCYPEANEKRRMIMEKGIKHRRKGENRLVLLLNAQNTFWKYKLSSAILCCPTGLLFTSASQLWTSMGFSLFVSECVCTEHGGLPYDIFAYKQHVQIHRGEERRGRKGGIKKETENKVSVNVCAHMYACVCFSWKSMGMGREFVANMQLQRVHLFPPPFLSKSETSMCQQLREMGGGVDDVHCCVTEF